MTRRKLITLLSGLLTAPVAQPFVARADKMRRIGVLMHPSLPTAASVRTALDLWAQRLVKAGVEVAHASPLLPDLADSVRLFMRLLVAPLSEKWPLELYKQVQAEAAKLKPDDNSLAAI